MHGSVLYTGSDRSSKAKAKSNLLPTSSSILHERASKLRSLALVCVANLLFMLTPVAYLEADGHGALNTHKTPREVTPLSLCTDLSLLTSWLISYNYLSNMTSMLTSCSILLSFSYAAAVAMTAQSYACALVLDQRMKCSIKSSANSSPSADETLKSLLN